MGDENVNSGSKIKSTSNKKEVDVSCWNCFTTEEFNNDLKPVPLSKIREEQRTKFKLYSFLASELSKPKAVTLKQKVSEHYSVGKKIDETIIQNIEKPQYLPDNTDLQASINDHHFTYDNNTITTRNNTTATEGSLCENHNESPETEIKINKVKLSRSDSSSSSSQSPDFKPKRKSFKESNITHENNHTTVAKISDERISSCENKNISNFKNISGSPSIHTSSKFRDTSPISQRTRFHQSNASEDDKNMSKNTVELCEENNDFQTSKISPSISRVSKLPVPKRPSQKQLELLGIGKPIEDRFVNYSKSNEFLPISIPRATKKLSTSASNFYDETSMIKSESLKRKSLVCDTTLSSPQLKECLEPNNHKLVINVSNKNTNIPTEINKLGFSKSNSHENTEELGRKNISTKEELDYTLKSSAFNYSLPTLNKTTGKKILKSTTTTKSLSTEIINPGVKSPSKSLRWRSTLSFPSKSISFQDDVYMSDTVSSGNATLPRRSSSPLPHDRDLDRDRFPINRSGLQARSESMASVYSGAGEGARGSVAVRGEVQFSLVYNYRLGALEVGVKRCRDLAPVDTKRNRSDPYIKVYLLPDKSKAGKRKTKVKKNTLNPVFEETLCFVQPLAALSARTLWLSAWHADMFGRNDFLGEVTLPLADVVFDDPAPTWHKLHERTEQFDEQQGTRGDLIVGLKFESHDASPGRGKGTLHVLVKEAKNLVATKPNGLADVFCKSYLLPERGRLAKQKTTVARRTLNPRWEHTFTYRGLTMQELATRALELSLWDRDRLASNDFMGAVRLSLGTGTYMGASVNWMDSMGKEVALWQTMMQRPNFWVEGSLPLRPQLNN